MSRKYYIEEVLSDSGSDEGTVSFSDLTLARDAIDDLPVDTDCVNSRSVNIPSERINHDRKQRIWERDEARPRDVGGISDFSLSESLSTIPVASEGPETPRSIKEVYRELHAINEKLRVSTYNTIYFVECFSQCCSQCFYIQ
ncbi:hypothetical protein NP493_311g01012 [Ridgeia piscesae]|uniref:Uncharacterized protein n=1 Tax=Ridgeia piscesae TaxID=27915 RepID=A0AAD9NUZ3_RIDPI|nr:hypothetical protein NP493_311g01012 [Ridgeia piscesae]